jgi:hypothetical protein
MLEQLLGVLEILENGKARNEGTPIVL